MKKMKKSLLCFLFLGVWLLTSHSVIQGARLAGEEDTTPTPPKSRQKVQSPAPVRPPTRTPPARQPLEGKAPQNNVVAQEEKAPEEATSGARYVTIDFDNVDIALFIKFISELTGKNFVIDKAVKGKVTIISPTKIWEVQIFGSS